MLGEEDSNIDRLAGGGRRAYLRSVSWSDRSPNKPNHPNPRSQTNSKVRSCLPPLQPLSITKRPVEEWPKAGSDDLGVWPSLQTPRGGSGNKPPLHESPKLDQQPVREFEFKKDKLAFFDKECSRIADYIYLGSDAVAKNREILRQNGITHVLNCVGFVCPEYFKNDLVYKTLWLQDSPSEDITSILYDVFDYFEDVREQGGRVFVHCCQGVSRSTSLVIAYLMWREGQSFEDAFQYVKAARGVTNPNMGFACQLLLCQKRVHAVPASPNSVLRIYRMAPHSSYDPLHLVPKMLNHPSVKGFDSRGAFVVHIPSAIYVWVGNNCNSVMAYSAREAANQVVRYERAQGPIISIKEGEEPSEFWDAIASKQLIKDIKEEDVPFFGNEVPNVIHIGVGERRVDDYDFDFELFQKAVAGGVVPLFSVSNTGSETCLPTRENGWGRLRRKFASGIMKELFTSSKLKCAASPVSDESNMMIDTCKESEDAAFVTDSSSLSSPSIHLCGSPDSLACSPISCLDRVRDTCKEVEHSSPLSDPLLPQTPPCGSPDSLSCFLGRSPQLGYKSPTLSPSTSDYSSLFTFSPSSCNWSDLSYLSSRQPSPSGLEALDPSHGGYASSTDNSCSPCKETPPSPKNVLSANHTLRVGNTCFPCKGISPSIAERRGSNPPPRLLPSASEPSLVTKNLVRSGSFSLDGLDDDEVMKDVDDNQFVYEDDREDLTQLKTIGSKFLYQMGSPVNASVQCVQIVREDKEPEQLLNHLNCFSFQKAKDSGDY